MGAHASAGAHRRRCAASRRRSHRMVRHRAETLRGVRLPRASLGAGVSVPDRADVADGDRGPNDGQLPPVDGGRRARHPLRLSVISIPAGFGGDARLPIGLQMIGRPRDDYSLLELAHRWERTAPWMAARSARSSLRQLTRQGRSGSTDARAIAAASWSIGARVRVSLLVRSTTSAATPNSAPAAKAPR